MKDLPYTYHVTEPEDPAVHPRRRIVSKATGVTVGYVIRIGDLPYSHDFVRWRAYSAGGELSSTRKTCSEAVATLWKILHAEAAAT